MVESNRTPNPLIEISTTQVDFTFYSNQLVAIVDTVEFEFTKKGKLTKNTLKLMDHTIGFLSSARPDKGPSIRSIGSLVNFIASQVTADRGDQDDPGSAENTVIYWNYQTS